MHGLQVHISVCNDSSPQQRVDCRLESEELLFCQLDKPLEFHTIHYTHQTLKDIRKRETILDKRVCMPVLRCRSRMSSYLSDRQTCNS